MYEKTEWQSGDKITKDKLNKIEDGIYNNSIESTYSADDYSGYIKCQDGTLICYGKVYNSTPIIDPNTTITLDIVFKHEFVDANYTVNTTLDWVNDSWTDVRMRILGGIGDISQSSIDSCCLEVCNTNETSQAHVYLIGYTAIGRWK